MRSIGETSRSPTPLIERTPLRGCAHSKISLDCLFLSFLGVPLNSRRLLCRNSNLLSSRIGLQWRVIYRITADDYLFQVASLTARNYRKV